MNAVQLLKGAFAAVPELALSCLQHSGRHRREKSAAQAAVSVSCSPIERPRPNDCGLRRRQRLAPAGRDARNSHSSSQHLHHFDGAPALHIALWGAGLNGVFNY